MSRHLLILAGLMLLFASHGPALGADKESGMSMPFTVANVHFEQNATDDDVEVVFEIKGGDAGLVKVAVVSPSGHTVIDFTAPDAFTLGMRQIRCESPERRDAESIKLAYPEGIYTFTAVTSAGVKFHGKATLSHELSPIASFIWPRAGAEHVDGKNLKIAWTPVPNLAFYILEIAQEELGISITSMLSGSVNMFAVPDGFLLPGRAYELSLGTVADNGNVSFAETTFTTAGTMK